MYLHLCIVWLVASLDVYNLVIILVSSGVDFKDTRVKLIDT